LAKNFFDQIKNWDVLIILDGCRYDTFKKINYYSGELHKIISLGSCTPDWAQASFANQQLKEVVYLSANPFVSNYYLSEWKYSNLFYRLEEVWDDGWENKLKTVPPRVLTKKALTAFRKYKNKKFVLHYMQPHHPFIGKTKIKERGWLALHVANQNQIKEASARDHVYKLLEDSKIDLATVMTAYEDNLRLVLAAIQPILKLTQSENKKVVITSDHGNCFGEYGVYGHPEKTFVREMLQVPWFEFRGKSVSLYDV
jgi:hypothetical protein